VAAVDVIKTPLDRCRLRRVRVGREGSPGACITVVPDCSRSLWIHYRYIDLTIRRPHRPSLIPIDADCPRDLSSGCRLSSSVHTDETPLAVIVFRWLEPVFLPSFFCLDLDLANMESWTLLSSMSAA
jgi:hypothetical protein